MSSRFKTTMRYVFLSVMCLKYVSILVITTGTVVSLLGFDEVGELIKMIGVCLSFKEFSSELSELKEFSDE